MKNTWRSTDCHSCYPATISHQLSNILQGTLTLPPCHRALRKNCACPTHHSLLHLMQSPVRIIPPQPAQRLTIILWQSICSIRSSLKINLSEPEPSFRINTTIVEPSNRSVFSRPSEECGLVLVIWVLRLGPWEGGIRRRAHRELCRLLNPVT